MKKYLVVLCLTFIITLFSVGCADNKGYEIEGAIFEDGNIKITFPVVNGLKDEVADKINSGLKEKAFAEIDDEDLKGVTVSLNYEVMEKSDKVLSVLYKGYVNHEGAAYARNLLYTANFDVTNGQALKLKDFTKIDESFAKTLKQDYVIIDRGNGNTDAIKDAFDLYLDNYDMNQLVDLLKNSDGKHGISDVNSYVKGDKIGVVFSVIHAIGDYVNVEIASVKQ